MVARSSCLEAAVGCGVVDLQVAFGTFVDSSSTWPVGSTSYQDSSLRSSPVHFVVAVEVSCCRLVDHPTWLVILSRHHNSRHRHAWFTSSDAFEPGLAGFTSDQGCNCHLHFHSPIPGRSVGWYVCADQLALTY